VADSRDGAPTHAVTAHPLAGLFTYSGARSMRASSWDRTGANRDFVGVKPGQTIPLLEQEGPGCINHLYVAMITPEITDYRDAILRCYWDGEDTPSVEVPLGDFFGIAHGRIREMRTHLTTVNPGFGVSHGLNAYFPMPFATHALITLENRADAALGGMFPALWYHIDYDVYETAPPVEALRFHAQYRQERPTVAVGDQPNVQLHDALNIGGDENYVALEASGAGQMVGLLLQINNLAGGWYGEGDDMVFVDGETWPPFIHGTGTEEIFGGGACPNREYSGPYSGFHLIESPDYSGLSAMYRWYVHDPIRFRRSLRWTVEHGHANNFANEYFSTAFWYQGEPHAPFPALPARDEMRPPLGGSYEEARTALQGALRRRSQNSLTPFQAQRVMTIGESFYRGEWEAVIRELAELALDRP
jgi:Protein of unknown function (DUF2961)